MRCRGPDIPRKILGARARPLDHGARVQQGSGVGYNRGHIYIRTHEEHVRAPPEIRTQCEPVAECDK
jgi:hypothetical protein